jgi:hypothetical protein
MLDDNAKRKIRRASAILNRVAAVLCIMYIAAIPIGRYIFGGVVDFFVDELLADSKMALVSAQVRFRVDRIEDVRLFAPPLEATGETLWAKSIQGHYRQPVAVFVWRHGKLNCPLAETFTEEIARVSKLFPVDSIHWRIADTVGTTVRYSRTARGDSVLNRAHVIMLRDVRTDDFWGVILREEDVFRAFYCALQDSAKSTGSFRTLRSPAHFLESFIEIKSNERYPIRPCLRAFLNDELVFESFGTDTTAYSEKWTQRESPELVIRNELYLTDAQQKLKQEMDRMLPGWWNIPVRLFLLIIVYLNYRWIRRLTEPAV